MRRRETQTPPERISVFSGDGSEKYGGRWNPLGRRAVYASSSRIKKFESQINADEKTSTMDFYWVSGVNYLPNHDRWDVAEKVSTLFDQWIASASQI